MNQLGHSTCFSTEQVNSVSRNPSLTFYKTIRYGIIHGFFPKEEMDSQLKKHRKDRLSICSLESRKVYYLSLLTRIAQLNYKLHNTIDMMPISNNAHVAPTAPINIDNQISIRFFIVL